MWLKNITYWLLILYHQPPITLGASNTLCPTPVVDDIGKTYHTQERFNKIRAESNTLSTTYVHHRGKHHDEYKYSVNFCGANGAVAVEQRDKSGNKKTVARMSTASVLVGSDDWLLVQYYHGDAYHSKHCHGKERQAWIYLKCEEGGEAPTLRVIEEARYNSAKQQDNKDLICYYLFEYNHPAACTPKKKSLSGWAVLFILIVVSFSAYFLFGFLYLRFYKGNKGRDQIPNYIFWKAFGNLMADGCSFVCRREEHSNTYKGMAEELDIESDEDNNTLLPP